VVGEHAGMNSILLHLVKLVSWLASAFILENAPCALKRVYVVLCWVECGVGISWVWLVYSGVQVFYWVSKFSPIVD
jgi:hypothetical protein